MKSKDDYRRELLALRRWKKRALKAFSFISKALYFADPEQEHAIVKRCHNLIKRLGA